MLMLLTYTELLCNIILHYLYQIKVPLPLLHPYLKGEGYNLDEIMKAVTYTDDKFKVHFQNGEPLKYRISFPSKPLKSYFDI